MRHAYLKNGDVVAQVEMLRERILNPPTAGPNAYIGDYLRAVYPDPVLLLSVHFREKHYQNGKIKGHVFKDCPSKGISFRKALARGRAFLGVIIEILRFQPDRLLCGGAGYLLLACYMASRLLGTALVHSRHGIVEQPEGPLYRQIPILIENFILKRLPAVICNGPYLRHQLEKAGVHPECIFEFGVDCSPMIAQAKACEEFEELTGDGRLSLIVYVGRIEAYKGVFDLLLASRELLCEKPDLRLVYLGDGRDFEQLRQAVAAMKLTERVLLLGKVPHKAVTCLLKYARVLITPTRSGAGRNTGPGRMPLESRCKTAVEGLVMGVPIICPNSGPFPYLVSNGVNGLLYETDSLESLRQVMVEFFNDRELEKTLREGAAYSGAKLVQPKWTFAQAVEKAFSLVETKRAG